MSGTFSFFGEFTFQDAAGVGLLSNHGRPMSRERRPAGDTISARPRIRRCSMDGTTPLQVVVLVRHGDAMSKEEDPGQPLSAIGHELLP